MEELLKHLGPKVKGITSLYEYQKAVASKVYEEEGLHILIAPTGAGKTLTALLPFIKNLQERKRRGMYHVLPTKSLVNRFFREYSTGYLPGKKVHDRRTELELFGHKLVISRELGHISGTRSYMGADIVVSTRDVFVYSLVGTRVVNGYIDVPFGYIAGSYVVLDEVQMLQDEYSYGPTLLAKVIEALLETGSTVLVITATFPQKYLELVEHLEPKVYVIGSGNPYEDYEVQTLSNEFIKERKSELSITAEDRTKLEIAEKVREKLEERGPSVEEKALIVVNSVHRAIELYEKLKDFKPLLLHSRFTIKDRNRKEEAIDKSSLIIATQVIEAGLDLPDVKYMITEVAPVDALIQRIGRVGRDKRKIPQAEVLVALMSERELPYVYLKEGAFREIFEDLQDHQEEYKDATYDASIATVKVSWMHRELIEPKSFSAKVNISRNQIKSLTLYMHELEKLSASLLALENISVNTFYDVFKARPGDYVEVVVDPSPAEEIGHKELLDRLLTLSLSDERVQNLEFSYAYRRDSKLRKYKLVSLKEFGESDEYPVITKGYNEDLGLELR